MLNDNAAARGSNVPAIEMSRKFTIGSKPSLKSFVGSGGRPSANKVG